MGYKPNVPQSTDFISQSQRDFKNNYTTVNNVWGLEPTEEENVGDHVPILDPDTEVRGKHKKITCVQQAADPTTAADNADLYSLEANSVPEMHYQRNGDANGNQLTSAGGLSFGGLVLRAHVVFDQSGSIIKVPGVDEDGNATEIPQSFNIASITPNDGKVGDEYRPDYTITFTNTLGTADYIWVLQSYNKPQRKSKTKLPRAQMQPFNSGTYANVVTATSIRINGYVYAAPGIVTNPRNRSHGRFVKMMFQAYTVAL